jgi:hypothetical protein
VPAFVSVRLTSVKVRRRTLRLRRLNGTGLVGMMRRELARMRKAYSFQVNHAMAPMGAQHRRVSAPSIYICIQRCPVRPAKRTFRAHPDMVNSHHIYLLRRA